MSVVESGVVGLGRVLSGVVGGLVVLVVGGEMDGSSVVLGVLVLLPPAVVGGSTFGVDDVSPGVDVGGELVDVVVVAIGAVEIVVVGPFAEVDRDCVVVSFAPLAMLPSLTLFPSLTLRLSGLAPLTELTARKKRRRTTRDN